MRTYRSPLPSSPDGREEGNENSMRTKIISFLLATLLLVSIHFADAQQPKKVPRIGYLSSLDPARESSRAQAIRLALRELGYIEGQNIAIEYRYAEGKP